MAYREDIKVDITSMLTKMPSGIQDEVRDAMLIKYDWEVWRLAQNPIVDDTPANQLDFVTTFLADDFVAFMINAAADARIEAVPDDIDVDLNA
jgi:hypothetical protein